MRHLALLCVLAFGVLTAAEPPRLADSGLPPGRSEEVLPLGAAVHLRLAHAAKSLETLAALAQQFVPEEVFPPAEKALIIQPNGLLRLLGQRTVGAPIDAALIARLSGIDATRPVTLTLYPGGDGLDWILCLPVADHRTLGGMIVNLTRARSFTASPIGARPGWVVEGSNADLPQRFVVLCSKDAAYVCANERIAMQLAAGARLATDPVVAAAPAADLVVAISAAPAKPFIHLLSRQFSRLPPRMFDGLRDQFLRGLGRDGVRNLNLQLRIYSSFVSVQEVFSYGECLTAAALETFVPELVKLLAGVDGATLACEFRPEGLRVSATIQAAGIEKLAARPLPLPEVGKALAALPGDRLWFSVSGGRLPAQPGSLRADWLDLAVRKLAGKGFSSAFLPAVAGYWRAEERVPQLEDAAPWVLRTSVRPLAIAPAGPGLSAWLAAIQASVPLPDLEVLPRQGGDAVATTFAAMAAVENRNAERWTRVLNASLGDSRWLDTVSRFRREPRPGKAERLVYEDAWISRSGFFGYSQHELVNRIIAYSAERGSLHLLQRVDGDRTSWLDETPSAPLPLPPAIANLLAQVPAGADSLGVVRVLPGLAAILDGVEALEKALRHDLDAYLAACITAINSHVGDQPAVMKALQEVPMPLPVASLNIDGARLLYLVLPGRLRYPRPEVSPVLRQLFAGYLAQADAVGGLVTWTRSEPGRMTAVVHQDLRGLARLVRLTGNAVHTTFLATGEPLVQVRQILGHPADGEENPSDQVILYNTIWPESP